MSGISTHVLDSSSGRPATGVDASLEFRAANGWEYKGSGTTNSSGRIDRLITSNDGLPPGNYRVTFNTLSYFHLNGQECFYPEVVVVFEVADPDEHYHIPLLLSPFGYTTYRGN